MALTSSAFASEVGLRLLLSPTSSNIVLRSACVIVGVGFPVYSTFKAIETKELQAQEQWLVYWAVYGCFCVAENFSDKLLSWIPFYYHVKLVFLIWLQLPNNYGARQLFSQYLRPVLVKHQDWLDRIVDRFRNDMNSFILAHRKELETIVQTVRKVIVGAYQATEDMIQSSRLALGSSPLNRQDGENSGGLLPATAEVDPGRIQVPRGDSSDSSG
ncbi:hypothetical protein O6H91_06G103200 [Diphasiastrum complanatum]|uniref:Uncharacterized protein n=1 Tax=Diphasiastrum complanatum TaxID=34168 RepID=A0ACC2DH75_DIPCM|nr:hypothetical protein O6H91_06G103200 [Diphasiastrum complanatum]